MITLHTRVHCNGGLAAYGVEEMSEQIDWSKAPESAMVLLKHTRDGAYAVAESFSDDARTWHFPETNYTFRLMPSMWYVVSRRPTTPSWSGEGLPPVGVVCEVRNKTPGYCAFPWEKCTIALTKIGANGCVQICTIDHRGDFAIYYPEVDIIEFRPIRTPEQIAASEREAEINAMKEIAIEAFKLSRNGDDITSVIPVALYDAGYRKP